MTICQHLIWDSIGVFLFILQIVFCLLFYNSAGLNGILYTGWIILAVGIALIMLSRSVLLKKGRAPKGENWLDTTVVIKGGIYGVVRHPMYLGAMLQVLALVLISQCWISAAFAVIPLVLLYNAIREEDRDDLKKFGNAYKRYMKSVPRMNLPVGIIRLVQHKKKE
jgi:protein-S-isoprenylcysteine O-methyltransferase Ste14